MSKLIVLLFGIGLLGISWYGLSSHSYYIQIFMNLNWPFMLARVALVMILAAYTFVPLLRLHSMRTLLGIGGTALLSLGLISGYSPTLLGHGNNYILIGDTLTLIEGGILAVILCAELPARRSRLATRGFLYIKSLFATQPGRLANTPPRPAAILKTQP